jgi:hypothetical protein
MRRRTVIALGAVTLLAASLAAQTVNEREIIRKFAEKESAFREVWQRYTYKQKIEFQVLDDVGRVREQQSMVIEVYFTTDGKRQTRTLLDRGRLRSVRVSKEDIQDALEMQPFVLATAELPEYEIDYVGPERVDELDTYVFDVEPRSVRKDRRYFKGRIWVDTSDYQIVMTQGKAIPDLGRDKFPKFETRREQIDGKYWFPTWTMADDILRFNTGPVHIRETIIYEDFKKFEVDTNIKYGAPQPEKK